MPSAFPTEGRYLYLLNGEEVDVEERWRAEPRGEHQWTVHSMRRVPGLLIEVVAELESGLVKSSDVRWLADEEAPVSTRYRALGNSIELNRTGGTAEAVQQLIAPEPAAPLVLYPLMRIFTGPVISALAGQGGSGRVLVPDIRNPADGANLLLADVSERQVVQVSEEPGAEKVPDCSHWRFIGGQYTAQASFWLNSAGLLQRYCWNQGEDKSWDIRMA